MWPRAPLDHPGDDQPDGVRGAEHVDPHDPLDLLRGDVGERPVLPDARVGHEDVGRPELRFELADRAGQRLGSATSATAMAPRPPHDASTASRSASSRAIRPTVAPSDAAARATAAPMPRDAPVMTAVAPAHCTRADRSRET